MSKKNSLKKMAKAASNAVNLVDAVATTPSEDSKVSLPVTIKPDQIAGKTIGGEIIGLHTFKGKGFKGVIVGFRHDSGQTFGFPMTGILRNALARHIGSEDDSISLDAVKGLRVSIRGLGKGTTKDGKRAMNMMDVFIENSSEK